MEENSSFISDSQKDRTWSDLEYNISAICQKIDQCDRNSLPPIDFMKIIGSFDSNHFKKNMFFFFKELVTRFDLNPNSNILDIGCGCGRLSIPFFSFLKDGHYTGIDSWKEGILWCKNNLSSQNHNFNFYEVKTSNNYYLEDRIREFNNSLSVDIPSHIKYDLIFSISVFTHLIKRDAEYYLSFFNDHISSNSCIFLTCFIIDDYFFQYREKSNKFKDLVEEEEGCFYGYSKQDFFAGYTLSKFTSIINENGFKIVSHGLGKWARKPGSRLYQDSFVLISSSS